MSLRSITISLALLLVAAVPATAQSAPERDLVCGGFTPGGWLHELCTEVHGDSVDEELAILEGRLDGDDELEQISDMILDLPDADEGTDVIQERLSALDEQIARQADDAVDELGVIEDWIRERQRLRLAVQLMRELPNLPAELELALDAMPMADLQARIERAEALRLATLQRLVGLERLRLDVAEVSESLPPDEPRFESARFDGVWTSTYGDELVLTQDGLRVTGTYDYDGGRVDFDVVGERTLDGIWVEDYSVQKCDSSKLGSEHWGRLQLTFREDFSGYAGSWSYCDEPPGGGGSWSGNYVGGRPPAED